VNPAWHFITGEFPPAMGGVSDYTRLVSAGLAEAGETVHVWCPASPGPATDPTGVQVHRTAGQWSPADLRRIDAALSDVPGPRRLFVQWVPHAFGRRSMNVAFCRWVRRRAREGDEIDLMVHEPFLALGEGTIRQNVAAAVHRGMVVMLLGVARRVWVSIPAWAECLTPWAKDGHARFCWLPVPSTLPVEAAESRVARVRNAMNPTGGTVIGHFGTYDQPTRRQLHQLVPRLIEAIPGIRMWLMGRGSDSMATELGDLGADVRSVVGGTGPLDASELSCHLQACALLVQPYIDGASTRRTTLMAALEHGVPTVTTVGRLSEPFWASSTAVRAVPAGDLGALAAAVVELARDAERRRLMGAHARALYAGRFAIGHTIRALVDDRCQAMPGDRLVTGVAS